jgi:hypothetical protein
VALTAFPAKDRLAALWHCVERARRLHEIIDALFARRRHCRAQQGYGRERTAQQSGNGAHRSAVSSPPWRDCLPEV